MRNKNISTVNNPINRQSNIVIQELENEILIYDLNRNEAFCLNQTAGFIWQMCDGTKTIAEISQAVGKKFNSNISEDFVWLALEQLKKDELIENQVAPPTEFAGMSRREVIRKVGLASMVALPIVASMIAPTAVTAQSCLAAAQACTPSPSGGGCCPDSLCNGSICACQCVTVGDCISQTSCPSQVNCNMGVCAP